MHKIAIISIKTRSSSCGSSLLTVDSSKFGHKKKAGKFPRLSVRAQKVEKWKNYIKFSTEI